MTRARGWIVFGALLLLATWARVALVDGLADQGWFGKYLLFADQILAGDPPRTRIADVSPAYLWLVVLCRAVDLDFHDIRTLQIVMTGVAALFAAMTAKRFGGWIAAGATTLLLLGNRAVLVNATELEPETLILLLVSAAILAITTKHYALAGLLVGLTVIARPSAILTLALVALWCFATIRDAERRSMKHGVLFLASALLPVLVIVLVNARLTGHAAIMSPGTVFYEAHNPLSTGAAGVMPRIVADMNAEGREPDYLHVAYRIVAARATGSPLDARLSNRYWSGKALAFLRAHPLSALRLYARKAILTVHHYDVYDLITMKRKALELGRWPAIPFGVAFLLAVAAFVLRRDRRALLPVALFALATLAALILFNVSARQRNPLLVPLAILGGIAVAELVALARARNEQVLYVFGALMVATPLLGIEGRPMREDAYNWWAALQSHRADPSTASILETADVPTVPPDQLRAVALTLTERTTAPERLFDAAIALQKANAWREAELVLRSIEGYEPLRENRAVSSVAYYRARGAIRLRAPALDVATLLDRAADEAPGDPFVLALLAVTVDREAMAMLETLHDPFTRDYALAHAWADINQPRRAQALLASLRTRIPEWSRVAPRSR